MEFLEVYSPIIRVSTKSMLSGEHEEYEEWEKWNNKGIPIVDAFFKDMDIQEITICSSNIGFVKTFRKFYTCHHEEVIRLKKEAERKDA